MLCEEVAAVAITCRSVKAGRDDATGKIPRCPGGERSAHQIRRALTRERHLLGIPGKMSVSAVTLHHEDTQGENRVALIGVHAMRYLPGCVLSASDHEQLMWYSHILPDGMNDVSDCLRARVLVSGEVLHVVACAFDAFDFNAVGQSSHETPGGIAWDSENSGAWCSFFSSILRIAEMSEAHFPAGPHVFAPTERVVTFHAHFVTLWRYLLRRRPEQPSQETDFQLLGELDLYSPLLPRAVKGAAASSPVASAVGATSSTTRERETAYSKRSQRVGTVRVKADEPFPPAARKKRQGTISLSPALRKLTTRSLLRRNEPPPPEVPPKG